MTIRNGVVLGTWLLTIALWAGCDNSGQAPANGGSATLAEPEASDAETPGREPAATGRLRIAVIPKGTTHEFWKSIHGGAEKGRQQLQDVVIEWKGPTKEDDREQQQNVMQNFINMGVDGIVLAPLDDQALVLNVREAVQENIPVVLIDSGLRAEAGKDYVSYVSTDNYLGGVSGAKRLAEVLEDKGKVIMLRYAIGSASTMNREKGFMEEIAKHPNIEVISSNQYAGATTETAYQKSENLLNRFPNVDGIFCVNESATFGMLRALQTSGLAGKVKFVGFDSSPKFTDALTAGEMHGLVLQNPLRMGELGVKTMVAHLRGESVQQRIDTGVAVATPENMNTPEMAALLAPPFAQYLQ